MTRRRTINLVLTLIVPIAVMALLWRAAAPREPMYKGKPLAYWLDLAYGEGNWTEQGAFDAHEAILAAGTNAIPTLLLDLQAKDYPLVEKASAFLWRLGLKRIDRVSTLNRYSEAAVGFETLGSQAKDAVPALVGIYKRHISDGSASAAIMCLGHVDPESEKALPVIMGALGDTNFLASLSAATAIRRIHNQRLAVPALVECLRGTNDFARLQAEQCLLYFGGEAKIAVPELMALMNNPKNPREIRATALEAVENIDPVTAEKIPGEIHKELD